jgi:hypothetical protein
MLASITPLGERGRRMRWELTASAYVAGSLVGGAAAGALAGVAGLLALSGASAAARVGLVIALLAGGLVLDALGAVPGPRRQVDESWLDRYRGSVYGFGFGVQLGAGVLTLVTTSAVYVVLGAAVASASPSAGAAIGAVSGGLRGLTLLAARGVRGPSQLASFQGRMRSWRRPARVATLAAQAVLVAIGVGALVA